jgi:hypothetical protein
MNVIQIQMCVAGLRASRLTDAELPICFLGSNPKRKLPHYWLILFIQPEMAMTRQHELQFKTVKVKVKDKQSDEKFPAWIG